MKIKSEKGITLLAAAITIVILLILAGITSISGTTEKNIIEHTESAAEKTKVSEIIKKINLKYANLQYSGQVAGKTAKEIFEIIKESIDYENVDYIIGSKSMIITIDDKYHYTLLGDGTMLDYKFAYLDIADGSIELKSTGFIQGTNELLPYDSEYVITGTSTENTIKISEQGTYDVKLKDLNITSSSCAFDANSKNIKTGVNVNIFLEGNNYLVTSASHNPGLGFGGATPNINGVTNGSTLTINGNGSLYAQGGAWRPGIGSSWGAGNASNIIINSGNIVAKPGTNACAIGGGWGGDVSNIVINGGNITANPSNRYGIGALNGSLDNLIINGGNITIKRW